MSLFNKKYLPVILLISFATSIVSQNPNGYYNTINGKKAQSLKTTLSTLLQNHTVHDYSSMWTFFKTTDIRPDGSIWDMYSSTVRTSSWGMNREHAFPKSWWGGNVNAAYTDINHLYPSDADANMAKSNYPLGVVGSTTFNNGVTKVGYNVFPGYSSSADVFEPADEYKGDFARTYFYMVTCYQDYNWRYTYMVDQNVYPTLKTWAKNLLLQWHRQDPVSTKEINRNEAVFKIQNNRNPYIDYPNLVEYIWGDSVNYTYKLNIIDTKPVLATPTNDTKLDFGAVIEGDKKSRTLFVKGSNISSGLSIFIEPEYDYKQFSVSVDRVSKEQANTGYKLSINYNPSTTGNHTASIIIYDGGIQGSVKVSMTGLSFKSDSLKTPELLPATNITNSGFTANWKPQNFADSYCLIVYKYSDGQKYAVNIIDSIPESGYEISGLEPGKDYTYSLKTRIGSMLSPESSEMPVKLVSKVYNNYVVAGLDIYVSEGNLYVKTSRSGCEIELFDIYGRRLCRLISNGGVQTINDVKPGTYIVKYQGKSIKVIK